MVHAVRIWMRGHGAVALLAGGMVIYLALLMLVLLAGWRLAYPASMVWLGLAAIPAAGVAWQYLQNGEDANHDQDGDHEAKRDDDGEMR